MKTNLFSKLTLSLITCFSMGLIGNANETSNKKISKTTTSTNKEFTKAATTAFYFATDVNLANGCSKLVPADEEKIIVPDTGSGTVVLTGGTLTEIDEVKVTGDWDFFVIGSELNDGDKYKFGKGDATGVVNVTLIDITNAAGESPEIKVKSKGAVSLNIDNAQTVDNIEVDSAETTADVVIIGSTNTGDTKVESDLAFTLNIYNTSTAKSITGTTGDDASATAVIVGGSVTEDISLNAGKNSPSFMSAIIDGTAIDGDVILSGFDGKLSIGTGTTFVNGQKITGGDEDTFELSIEAGLVSKLETYGGTIYTTIDAAALTAGSVDLAAGKKIYLTIDGKVVEVQGWNSLTFFNGTVPTAPTVSGAATKTAVSGTNNWGTAAAWAPASVPTACENIVIATGANVTIPSGTINANKLTIAAGASLTVDPSATLTLGAGEVLTINSNATESGVFIGKAYTGQITYNRYVDNQWHIISSMVTDQSLNGFATNAANDITTGDGGTKYALGPYSPIADAWVYFTTATIAAAGDFAENVGYTFKRNTAGFATFTGTNNDGDATTTVLAKGVSNGYRSLGNPYPSYMDVNVGTPNFVTANDGILAAGAKNIFLFDLVTGKYLSIGDASADKYIIPGQGFLIKTDAGGTATISEDLQSIQSGGTLSRSTSSEITRIAMSISSGSLLGKANVYFHENGAKGMDNDDYLVFTDYDFDIYSKLLDGSYADNNFNTQSLPNKDYETMVVSLGINAAINSTVEFSFTHEALPAGYMLFLEDKELATMTRVDDGTTYSAVINANGTGRFFLHTSTSVLATETTIASKVSIFSANTSVEIKGLSLGKTTVTMYDLLGRVIVKDSFSDKNSHAITTSSLTKGSVYVVDIETTEGKVTKKVIIQ
ncbi:T9SS type A sorting domain-containing protein [Polaribacter sp.]|uniref:T9SS type A sorting domain-containing protein n=1 Tax=Polaribacter sp. TaxID=1920175 RepID=UPI003EF97067